MSERDNRQKQNEKEHEHYQRRDPDKKYEGHVMPEAKPKEDKERNKK